MRRKTELRLTLLLQVVSLREAEAPIVPRREEMDEALGEARSLTPRQTALPLTRNLGEDGEEEEEGEEELVEERPAAPRKSVRRLTQRQQRRNFLRRRRKNKRKNQV